MDAQNKYREANLEAERAKSKRWYANNKDHAKEWKRKWLTENRDIYAERRIKYRGSINGRSKEMFAAAKWSAKQNGLAFDLDIAWIQERLSAGVCELTNIHFQLAPLPKGRQNPYTASIDRILPEKGYVKSNVRVILWALNAAFNSYGEQVYADIAKVYLAKRGTGLT